MIDIQGQSGNMEDPLSTSTTMVMRKRSSNGRFKSAKKRATAPSRHSARFTPKKSPSNSQDPPEAEEKSTSDPGNSQGKRSERHSSPRSEKSQDSDASEVSFPGNRRQTRMSRRLESDASLAAEDLSTHEKASAGSSGSNKPAEHPRKRRRTEPQNSSPTSTKSTENESKVPTKEKGRVTGSARKSSSGKQEDKRSTKKASSPSKKSKSKAAKNPGPSKKAQAAPNQVSYTYLPKKEHHNVILQLEHLRNEYKKLSGQVESWHAEIKRLTEPDEKDARQETGEGEEEEEGEGEGEDEEEIIPLIVQRPQRNRRKPARILYDL